MSYCSIISFKDGKFYNSADFSNAFGGAAFIWTALFDRYLKNPAIMNDSWFTRIFNPKDRSLWDLAQNKELPLFERAVHASTFDYATIKKRNFGQFAEHLRQFVDTYLEEGKACHLLGWAEFVESCEGEAIGFMETSVSGSVWDGEWDEEKEEYIPYDFKKNKHFDVYEWLGSQND